MRLSKNLGILMPALALSLANGPELLAPGVLATGAMANEIGSVSAAEPSNRRSSAGPATARSLSWATRSLPMS